MHGCIFRGPDGPVLRPVPPNTFAARPRDATSAEIHSGARHNARLLLAAFLLGRAQPSRPSSQQPPAAAGAAPGSRRSPSSGAAAPSAGVAAASAVGSGSSARGLCTDTTGGLRPPASSVIVTPFGTGMSARNFVSLRFMPERSSSRNSGRSCGRQVTSTSDSRCDTTPPCSFTPGDTDSPLK